MNIALIGATGLVGRKIISVLNERGLLKKNNLVLYASPKSGGTTIKVGRSCFLVSALSPQTIQGVDVAIFSAGKTTAKKYAPLFAKRGAFVIDNSSAFRRSQKAVLIVPEINPEQISVQTKIIANPNCSTIGLVLILREIEKLARIKRVVVSTYQAVSGAGKIGLDDLAHKTAKKFNYPISNNLIPQIDVMLKNGNTFEEDKMIYETQRILGKRINLSATCVRVPIKNCHSESINIELAKPVSIPRIKKALLSAPGISLTDFPMPLIADNQDNIIVGRIRKDHSTKNAINLFISFDNLRKGAATNAVQILEILQSRFF